MTRLYEILSLNNDEIDNYIEQRINDLNSSPSYDEISLTGDGSIYENWINTNTTYRTNCFTLVNFKQQGIEVTGSSNAIDKFMESGILE